MNSIAQKGLPCIMCDACNGLTLNPLAKKRGYNLYRCATCGLILVFPQPTAEQISRLYSKNVGYFTTANTDISVTANHYARELNAVFSANGINKGHFFDIGCATGNLLFHMREIGWQTTGIDINPDAVAVAVQNGLDVTVGSIEESSLKESSFDVVHLGDVIEHVISPKHVLLNVRRILKVGGLLVIKTSNVACGFGTSSLLLTKVSGLEWPQSEAPYHLYEFSPRSLTSLVTSCGYDVLTVKCAGKISFFYTLGATGFFDNLKSSMKTTGQYRLNLLFLLNIPKLTIVALVLLPFFVWGRIRDKWRRTGPRMTLIARRP